MTHPAIQKYEEAAREIATYHGLNETYCLLNEPQLAALTAAAVTLAREVAEEQAAEAKNYIAEANQVHEGGEDWLTVLGATRAIDAAQRQTLERLTQGER